MSKVGDFFTWLFLSLLLLWTTGMIFAGDPCTRVHRAAWPVVYGMGAVEALTQNWTSDSTKLSLLKWKAKGAVASQEFFEKTAYGEEVTCSK